MINIIQLININEKKKLCKRICTRNKCSNHYELDEGLSLDPKHLHLRDYRSTLFS